MLALAHDRHRCKSRALYILFVPVALQKNKDAGKDWIEMPVDISWANPCVIGDYRSHPRNVMGGILALYSVDRKSLEIFTLLLLFRKKDTLFSLR